MKPSFEGAILGAQVLTSLFLSLTLAMMLLIARKLRLATASLAVIMVIAAVCGPALAETANGMEMTLFSASSLVITYCLIFRRSSLAVLLATGVFLTTRFEAIFYFPFLIAPLVLERRFREAVLWAAAALAIFIGMEVLRNAEFGVLMPNTIFAKMHEPYRTVGFDAIRSRIDACLDLMKNFAPFALADLALWVLVRHKLKSSKVDTRVWLVLALPILAAELFDVAAGSNKGYRGRMEFFAIPYALLLLASVLDFLRPAMNRVLYRVGLGAALICLPLSWYVAARTVIQSALNRENTNVQVTPESYRRTGLSVDRVRSALGLQSLTFMTPDVGGASLCCSRLRIVDLGLLTNRMLARDGYPALPQVLRIERPDVIGVHAIWATLSRIYSIDAFKQNYVPVLIDQTRLFLRQDLASRLTDAGLARWCAPSEARCAQMAAEHRYREPATPDDDAAFLERGMFLSVRPE